MLFLIQTSAWTNWRHDIIDESGSVLGQISAPTWAQATNSRLQMVAEKEALAARMNVLGEDFVVRFEYLRRGWSNDVAWWLESAHGVVLSRVEKIFEPGATSLPRHYLRSPDDGEFKVVSARTLRPFEVTLCLSQGQQVMQITTRAWLRLRLRLEIDGAFGTVAQRAFWAYYAMHLR